MKLTALLFTVLTGFSFALIGALLQYYLLLRALSTMREAAMASLSWPMLIGVNVTTFSIFCRLKWKEKYPPATILGMAGCVAGIIMMIVG